MPTADVATPTAQLAACVRCLIAEGAALHCQFTLQYADTMAAASV